MAGKKLNTAVIYGSVRRARRGIGVARFIARKLTERKHTVRLIDPMEHQLPMLDLMYKEYGAGEAPAAMASVAKVLADADGFIVVSGEYNHSVPPALKNLLDHYQSEYHYKPSGIVSYSAGPFGGVRALTALRAILAELGTPSIPSAFPVSQIYKTFDNDGNAIDSQYEERVTKFLDEYEWYAHTLRLGRDSGGCVEDIPTQQAICQDLSAAG